MTPARRSVYWIDLVQLEQTVNDWLGTYAAPALAPEFTPGNPIFWAELSAIDARQDRKMLSIER